MRLKELCKIEKKFNYLIGTKTRDLLACSTEPPTTTLQRFPPINVLTGNIHNCVR
jgi:hypothetical protein